MSSSARGRLFEERVFGALSFALESGALGLRAPLATIHSQRQYPSRDRDAVLTVDIAIELVLTRNARPALVWVFECKSLRRALPVDDVEEFHAKLQQIGEDNTKGTIVTEGALQSGALSYARAKGIGVIRVPSVGELEHVLYSSASMNSTQARAECQIALLDRNYRGPCDLAAEIDGKHAVDWPGALKLVMRRWRMA